MAIRGGRCFPYGLDTFVRVQAGGADTVGMHGGRAVRSPSSPFARTQRTTDKITTMATITLGSMVTVQASRVLSCVVLLFVT
jgi:hypothetical protein